MIQALSSQTIKRLTKIIQQAQSQMLNLLSHVITSLNFEYCKLDLNTVILVTILFEVKGARQDSVEMI